MLPPTNSSTLERNPRFKALYQDLVKSRLNADGSSRLIKQQRAQTDIEKSLQILRRDHARTQILQEALYSITESGELPDELLQSCRIVAATLNGEISSSDSEILEDDLEYFIANIPKVAVLISNQVQKTTAILTKMAIVEESSSTTNAQETLLLPARITALINSIASHTAAISSTRARITDLADHIHTTHRDILEMSVRILEQTIHGSVARGLKARVEHLSSVAKALNFKIRIVAKSDPYLSDPSLASALQTYSEHLGSMERELLFKAKAAESELQKYAEAGKGMEQIANRFAELIRECEKVEAEIKRLEK